MSLTADLIGLGGYPGFGWKQILGTLVALVIVVLATAQIVMRDRGSAR